MTGEGKEQDFKQAKECFRKPKGHVGSLFQLGKLFREGSGVEKNRKIAFEFFEKASKFGHVEALRELGQYFRFGNGNGIDKNEEKSLGLLKLAAEKGDEYLLKTLRYLTPIFFFFY